MYDFDALDSITAQRLRAAGSVKWSGPKDMIGAFIAEMDFGAPEEVIQAVHEGVASGALGYQPPHLVENMSRAVAGYYAQHCGWEVAPDNIFPMGDVVSVYRATLEHFSGGPDDPAEPVKVIVPTPAYPPFLRAPELAHAEVIEAPMRYNEAAGRFEHDLDTIRAGFEAGGTLLVVCNPHNPLGRVFDRAELAAIAELVDEYDGRVFADEIWMPLIYDDRVHIPYASVSEAAANHTITGVAVSKGFNVPGLKTAQLITSNEADRASWEEVGFFSMTGASNLGLVAAEAAFTHGEEWLEGIRAYLKRNLDFIMEFMATELPDAKLLRPEGTYVAWIDLSAYDLGEAPAEYLREHARVDLTEGADSGRAGAGHVRLIFATPLPILRQALEQIRDVLAPLAPAS